jgi:hypothetical protein
MAVEGVLSGGMMSSFVSNHCLTSNCVPGKPQNPARLAELFAELCNFVSQIWRFLAADFTTDEREPAAGYGLYFQPG